MITAVLIDDEISNVEHLGRLLAKHCREVNVIGSTNAVSEARMLIEAKAPDLVFLDIEMPKMNGFDLLQSLTEIDFEVIFVTAHDQYGIQAVKFAAIDYLLKPVVVSELQAAVAKVVARAAQRTQHVQLEHLMQFLKQQSDKDTHRIALPTSRETRFVRPAEIIRCESSNSYTHVYLVSGENYLIARPIYEYEEMLFSYGFFRCHQSHLVNRHMIKSWIKTYGDQLLLTDGSKVPLSRQKREALKELLSQR